MIETAQASGRKTLIVAAVVILLLAVAIAVAAARGSGVEPVSEKPGDVPVASDPASETTGAPSSAAETVSAGSVPPGLKPGEEGAAPSPDQRPAPSPAAPKQPAASGSRLATLTAPPEKTIGMIVVPKGFTSGEYSVTLKPFGWGPGGQKSGRLVAQIVTAKAADEGAKTLDKDFAGRNTTLWCVGQVADAIELGGDYSGVMQVRPQGDVGVLYLTEVKAAK